MMTPLFLIGSQVLTRACQGLEQLVKEARVAKASSVAAVSHSAFLRVLLGILLDESLLQAASRKIWNGSVTVVDIPQDFSATILTLHNASLSSRPLGRGSKLLGGILSTAPRDFQLAVPQTCQVLRVSEFAHLPPSTLR